MLVIIWAALASAATLQVGPDKPYTTVAAAIAAAQSDDEIAIDSGVYLDDTAVLPAVERLTLRGVGPTKPILRVTQPIANRKGILVVPVGAWRVTIENLQFEDAFVTDEDGGNGAGIRMQGARLVVNDCVFLRNQMGILTGGTPDHTVEIYRSEFGYSGRPGSGYEHNVYINDARSLTFEGNYSHHAASGHTLKSRATYNTIRYNRLMDEGEGTSSYLIDLPNGGSAVVVGNLIQQGPNAENRGTLVSFGAEGGDGPHRLQLAHNTFVNDHPSADPAFVRILLADEWIAYNNLFVGAGDPYVAAAGVPAVEGGGDLATDDPGLLDRAGYDYRLLSSSPAVDAGVVIPPAPPEFDDAETVAPEFQYVHPTDYDARRDAGLPDVGAYALPLDETPDPDTDDTDPPADTSEPVEAPRPGEPDEENAGCACHQGGSRWAFAGWFVVVAALTRRSRVAVVGRRGGR